MPQSLKNILKVLNVISIMHFLMLLLIYFMETDIYLSQCLKLSFKCKIMPEIDI